MSWIKRELKRSHTCNGKLIKSLRLNKGWSQKQLAKEAGYSERLVCKAESGGRIAVATLEILAIALQTAAQPLKYHDLIVDPILMAKLLNEALHSASGLTPSLIESLADNVYVEVLAAPGLVPFTGQFRGRESACQAFEDFFAEVSYADDVDSESTFNYFNDGFEVVMWGKSYIREEGSNEIIALPLTRRMVFEEGKLVVLEDRYSCWDNVGVNRTASPEINDRSQSNTGAVVMSGGPASVNS